MKTCISHGYNPPSRCPNCRISARRTKRTAACKGWQKRRQQQREVAEMKRSDQEAEYVAHGWVT